MKTARILAVTLAAALGLAAAWPAAALQAGAPAFTDIVLKAEADCYSIGERVAAQQGGTLARAAQATRGGRTVCVIVVLVPGRDGQRPRRAEIVVPAN